MKQNESLSIWGQSHTTSEEIQRNVVNNLQNLMKDTTKLMQKNINKVAGLIFQAIIQK